MISIIHIAVFAVKDIDKYFMRFRIACFFLFVNIWTQYITAVS